MCLDWEIITVCTTEGSTG